MADRDKKDKIPCTLDTVGLAGGARQARQRQGCSFALFRSSLLVSWCRSAKSDDEWLSLPISRKSSPLVFEAFHNWFPLENCPNHYQCASRDLINDAFCVCTVVYRLLGSIVKPSSPVRHGRLLTLCFLTLSCFTTETVCRSIRAGDP